MQSFSFALCDMQADVPTNSVFLVWQMYVNHATKIQYSQQSQKVL